MIFDATHSVQMPSKDSGVSGGNPEFIAPLARAAAGVGVDGFFIETHPNPAKAFSDAKSMMKLSRMQRLLEQINSINKLARSFKPIV